MGRLLAGAACLSFLIAWQAGATSARADDVTPDKIQITKTNGVDGIATSLTGAPGDPKAGEKTVANRRLGNCFGCHEIKGVKEPFQGEVGPPLTGVGGRWDAAALRLIIVNPKKVFGDQTVMPAFYRTEGLNRVRPEFVGKPILTAKEVEDVVAYLTTLK